VCCFIFLQGVAALVFYFPPFSARRSLNLHRADLRNVNLARMNLRWANLTETILERADLRGTDLRDTIGLTGAQLALAQIDHTTRLPGYLTQPPEQTATPANDPAQSPNNPGSESSSGIVEQTTDKNYIIKIEDVLFDSNEAIIRDETVLQHLAERIRNSGDGVIQVNGYTDSVNTQSYNLRLSRLRAQSVVRWLIAEAGIDSKRFRISAFGKRNPAASNVDETGRSKNRRVEVIVPR
jgi:outer membrane protein OmpA-like peptidoglycan-associated protein